MIAGLVGAGFDYQQVLEMTWSQLTSYSRALELERISEWRMRLAIAHNPYAKDKEAAMKLWRHFDQAERAIRDPGREDWEPARPKGISLQQLKRVMGEVKENLLPREEWERQQATRLEQKAKAERAMAELRERRRPKAMNGGTEN